MDSDNYGPGNSQDTSLVSPVVNLSGQTSPEIGFDTFYNEFPGQTADVDLSLDGGQTWTNVWEQTSTSVTGPRGHPDPAGGREVQRARCGSTSPASSAGGGSWTTCSSAPAPAPPPPGGLVAGIVTDNNTGNPVNGATVASNANSGQFGVSAADAG